MKLGDLLTAVTVKVITMALLVEDPLRVMLSVYVNQERSNVLKQL
jgi:hypothetical protein